MKLNPECIRDILLTVEENTSFSQLMEYPFNNAYTRLLVYNEEEVLYHIKQCQLSGLLTKVNWYLEGGCLIHDLSPIGHEFLVNIRNDNNWKKTKEISKDIGSASLDVLKQIAAKVISNLIEKQF